MAKTFIADKETLDLVKLNTDKIGTFSDSSEQSLFAAINSLKKGGSALKSVQRGVLQKINVTTYDDYGRYCDVTISAVNISKSFLIVNSSSETFYPNAKLVNSTTIRFYQSSISSSKASFENYNWQVIEFN